MTPLTGRIRDSGLMREWSIIRALEIGIAGSRVIHFLQGLFKPGIWRSQRVDLARSNGAATEGDSDRRLTEAKARADSTPTGNRPIGLFSGIESRRSLSNEPDRKN